jgi:hypothetical protein
MSMAAKPVADQVKDLNNSTAIMDKNSVKSKIKELKKAYKNRDRQRLYDLSDDFSEIDGALGYDSKEDLLKEWERLNNEINTNGASNLNIAKLKNNEAKLGIINYRGIIHEAANASSYEDHHILEKQDKDRKSVLLIAGSAAALTAVIASVGVANKIKNDNSRNISNGTTTGVTTLDSTTAINTSSETINEVYESTKNNSVNGYTLESINIDYSSPTRETTSKDDRENGSYVTPDATISTIRNTTPNDEVTVIVEPTFETEPVSYETSAIPTNVDGVIIDDNNDPVPTTSYIEPTGTDPLPVEPSHETISLEDLMEDYSHSEVTKGKAKVLSLR